MKLVFIICDEYSDSVLVTVQRGWLLHPGMIYVAISVVDLLAQNSENSVIASLAQENHREVDLEIGIWYIS